ncbi:hypothetical protein [Paraliomyxa miuraensis]|uniref:hypothetical protein n=1 Tax=Paraliomyxa miuraensis TaxID=376150 RepID=UPI00225950B4|nr:hypothetical protein [Paraliomyxa miuraensis]MCX4246152.1 hypothetical protein [Paraliomyxa miuraensis]
MERSSYESWFPQLFGFREGSYEDTRGQFVVEGTTLRSLANGRTFEIGTFATPTLASLRERSPEALRGRLEVEHEAIGDVLELHALPANRGALFQVASQFNCLEFADPRQVPEDGITDYSTDPTQGPACSLAAAAATVYRNYFCAFAAPAGGKVGGEGQTRERQIDNLDQLAAMLGGPAEYFEVVNGYTWSDETRLRRLRERMTAHDRDRLLGAVKIGLQTGVGVTFARRFAEPPQPTTVSQAFCSALSCGYTRVGLDHWEPLATLVLDAAYEATLWAAALHARGEDGRPPRVWLTFLGGGAFGNRKQWIARAIGRALARLDGVALDVRIAHYRRFDEGMAAEIDRARQGALRAG